MGGGSFNIISACISLSQARHSGVPGGAVVLLPPPFLMMLLLLIYLAVMELSDTFIVKKLVLQAKELFVDSFRWSFWCIFIVNKTIPGGGKKIFKKVLIFFQKRGF